MQRDNKTSEGSYLNMLLIHYLTLILLTCQLNEGTICYKMPLNLLE